MTICTTGPLGHGAVSLPHHAPNPMQRTARMQVRVAASSLHNFPHHRARITHFGAIIPRPWSPAQGTPLAQPSPTFSEHIHPTPSTPQPALQRLQLTVTTAQAVIADRTWQQQQVQLCRQRLEHQLYPAIAAAQAWAQAAWMYAIAMWPVWVAKVQAILADARLAVEEAAQGRGPVAQVGKAWGVQRLSEDIRQPLLQLTQIARSGHWQQLQPVRDLQNLADALNSTAQRRSPQQPGSSSNLSSTSSGSHSRRSSMDGDEPMKQSAALALAAASITTKGVQPLTDFAFTFGRWGGKQQQGDGSTGMRMPWGHQAAEPNTDEVWAEMMGLPDGANWDSTWKEPADATAVQQQQQQGQEVQEGGAPGASDVEATRAVSSAGQVRAAVGSAGSRAVAQAQQLLAPALQQGGAFLQAHRGPATAAGLLVAAAALVAVVRRWSKHQAAAVQDEVVRQVSLQLKAEELAAQRARFKRVLVASEPNRESRKTALLMQQQEEQDWESSAAAAASATASATGSLAATAAAAAVKERAAAVDDAAMREWQRFVQQSRMGEVEQLWDPNMVDDEPQASAELLSRVTQQIRDAAKGDDDAESAMQAAAAAQREAERQELERLRLQQQTQQRRQQQQQEDAAGGLDAGAVQRARERRARAAAQALQQLQEAEQEREGSARAVTAANPFALSNEERAKWEADEHLYNDPKASKRGKQAAQQIISSVNSSTPSTNSSSAQASAYNSSPAEHGANVNGSQGGSPAAGRSGRSSPSGFERRQGTHGTLNPADAPSAMRAGSPMESAAAVPAAADALALTDEQRQEWGDWHEELGGIRGSAAGRRRRQQQQPNGHSDHIALATAVAIPEPPELLPAQLEVPLRPVLVQTQQRHSQQQGRGGAAWQQPLVQLIELLDEAGRLAARSIGASISASLRGSSSSSSNSGASRLRASSAQRAPERSAAAAREIRHAADGQRGMGLGVEAVAETQEERSLRQMREVAQELADEVVGASSLARGVAARDMDSVAAPAPVLPASVPQHGLASVPAGAAVVADAGGYEVVEHAAAAAGDYVGSVVQQRQQKMEAARADVNPFLMPAAAMLEYEEDEGAEREAEVARMQVVLPPVRAAFVQQRGP